MQNIRWGTRRCIRSSTDLEACALHAPAGLIHDRFMNSWEPKVQAWSFHSWLAQELRRIHLNDRDSLKDGWTYLRYDFKDHPPVQLLHNLDELLQKIPAFQKDCRDLHLVREVHKVPKSYGRGRDRKTRYQKVTEGGEISRSPLRQTPSPLISHFFEFLVISVPPRV